MVTLLLDAWQIPNGMVVTKATGTYEHVLIKNGLVCYSEKKKGIKNPPPVVYGPESFFIMDLNSDNPSFTRIGPYKKLAVHFDDIEHASEFLKSLVEENEQNQDK